jgi:hypothetical protein
LSHVVTEPLRGGILAMLGDGSPDARLREAARFYDPVGRIRLERTTARLGVAVERTEPLAELERVHAECLRDMLLDTSDAVRSVAGYRIAELGLDGFETELRSAAVAPTGALAELSDRAVGLMDAHASDVSRAG